METGFIILSIALVIVAIGGLYVFVNRNKSKPNQTDTQGMLNIVYDEFGGTPQLVLALYDPVETVVSQKQVLFDVNIIGQDSRK